jgi:hypothetical protein
VNRRARFIAATADLSARFRKSPAKMESRSESGIDVLKETCYSVARASEVACILYAKVAQSVEHSTENAGVGGSIPPLGTFYVPQPT